MIRNSYYVTLSEDLSMCPNLSTAQVCDWLTASVPVITPKTTIATALRLLREHGVPALPVCAGTRLLGLVDERALLRFTPSEMTTLDVYELREWLDRMTVARAVVPTSATVAPYTSLAEAGATMLRMGVDAIAVVDDGCLVGLLTRNALLKAAVDEPQATSADNDCDRPVISAPRVAHDQWGCRA
jgi:acetoin utilization protein AcuB